MPVVMTYKNKGLSYEDVREIFDYCPTDGHLRWRKPGPKRVVGGITGCPHTSTAGSKRVNVGVNYTRYLAHCIIWLWMTGSWPKEEIDHKDGNGWNNKWDNLREATRQENNRNTRIKNNATGKKGVRVTRNGDYSARLMIDYKEIHLGTFNSLEAAATAYEKNSQIHFGKFARIE